MRILVDMDGVVANFLDEFCVRASTMAGRIILPIDIKCWDLTVGTGLTQEQCCDIFSNPSFFDSLEPINGAVESIRHLSNEGHQIVFVTATPKSWEGAPSKVKWLRRNFEGMEYSVIVTEDKFLVPGDVLLEDSLTNVQKWKEAWPNGTAVLFNAAYNQGPVEQGCYRVYSWKEAGYLLAGLAERYDNLAIRSF